GGLPVVAAVEDCVVAVTGADIALRLGEDGPWLRPGTSVLVRGGTTLRATVEPRSGCRTYLAVPGGVDVPRVLGSASTSLPGGFGGIDGRRLQPGDVLRAGHAGRRTGAGHAWPGPGPSSGVTGESGPVPITVTDGPHRGSLEEVAAAILATDWAVDAASDRVGLRMVHAAGTADTAHDRSYDSFALAWGAIEVPPDGAPIVLLPDGPTVGGYPVPLVVARVDLPRLGQLRPGDHVRFRHVEPSRARADLAAADAALGRARAALAVMRSVW
ncbi:MAG: biotin-dependent carboxyltransferase family protein, partial [Candidatus Limnocylindrales bacterium]